VSLPNSHNRLEAVLFDLDGTLIDSTDAYFQIVNEAFKQLGLQPIGRRAILDAVKDGGFDWDAVLPGELKEGRDQLITKARGIIDEIYPLKFQRDVQVFYGVRKLLRDLSAGGLKIGLVTSTPMKNLKIKLTPLKKKAIDRLLDVIITTDDVPRKKPAPDPLILCGKRLGIALHKSVYIGDTAVDMQAGRAAGMKTIAVLTGMDSLESLKRENPDLILNNVAEFRETAYFRHSMCNRSTLS
jgi:HAD superfamily hydrolase (TIGR01549 family)